MGVTEPRLRPTEQRSEHTRDLDLLDTDALVRLLIEQEAAVVPAVGRAAPELGRLVDLAVATLTTGGRIHYAGAGTSGRIATLDAAELPGTFGVPASWFVAHHAGGPTALAVTSEDVEDEDSRGELDLVDVTAADLVVGISASGQTPYVVGALRRARAVGARTALISADPGAAGGQTVDVHVSADTGPEPVTGSTRMKAASAQKLVLTTLSTAVMVRMGRTYSNLMVGVVASNAKLRHRALRVLTDATGDDATVCEKVLLEAGGDVRVALVALLAGTPIELADAAVDAAGGRVREAIAQLQRAKA